MFGIFGKKKPMSGDELAEEGLRQVSIAVKNNAISLQKGDVFDDIYAHRDNPNGSPRLTYVAFNPDSSGEVVARCVILLDRFQGDAPVWQIDWAVLKAHRGKGYGKTIASKALAEFTSGMERNAQSRYAIEAIVDDGNDASIKIARSLLGGEKVILNKETGRNAHSFLRVFRA